MNKTPQLDYEGDTEMQGMRLELQKLTAIINKISVDGNGAKRKVKKGSRLLHGVQKQKQPCYVRKECVCGV